MNACLDPSANRIARGGAVSDPKQPSESEGARARIEGLIEQTHEAIQTLSVRLEPVLHKCNTDAASPEPVPFTTPAHAWLLDRETRLREALHRLLDLTERLEV